jgi:UDP-glucose 4-epimerase
MRILLTGGTGFFGSCLKRHFAKLGYEFVNFDVVRDEDDEKAGVFFHGDLSNAADVEKCFAGRGPFDVVCHVAAQLAHDVKSKEYLWKSNVDGTKNLAEVAAKNGVKTFVFTSTNCLWGRPLNHPVKEDEATCPVELYGVSKLEDEKILAGYRDRMNVVIFRSPTIMGAGRVGLMSILFDFILEGRRIPVVGRGNRPYQFIYADDYADAIVRAFAYGKSDTFNIGSDRPVSLEASYNYVIGKSGSKAKCYHLPVAPTVFALKILHKLHLSPLGPYQYNMIAEEFVFDTGKLKNAMGWAPTRTSQEAFFEAFEYYRSVKADLEKNHDKLPAHRRKADPGIIKLLKWVS